MKYKKLYAGLLAGIFMLSTVAVPVAADEDPAHEVEVLTSVQYGNEFLGAPQRIKVESNTAENYGLSDSVPADKNVSALDVLVQMHEDMFGSDDVLAYLDISGGYMNEIFGVTGAYPGFSVNNEMPVDTESEYGMYGYTGYLVNQAVVNDGDSVEFFYYEDPSYGDYISWFENGGERKGLLNAKTGEDIPLDLKGCAYMNGSLKEEDRIKNGYQKSLAGYTLSVIDEETGVSTSIPEAVTDENGSALISFDKAGHYLVGIIPDSSASGLFVKSPVLEINVEEESDENIQWKNFRGNDCNMGITNADTPVGKDETALKWNISLGASWEDSPSPMIITDGNIIVLGNKKIYKISCEDGSIVSQAEMSQPTSYALTGPSYGSNKIFAPLANGTIEAFSADTLEKKWTFTDELGGQATTPVTYCKGVVYTGFWNSETGNADFVAVDASSGKLLWKYESAGGFYWAGAVCVGDAVIFGTDDGAEKSTGNSRLLALNRLTGETISEITLEGMGDVRSSAAYCEENGRIYLTTKGGYIVSAKVDKSTGELSDHVSKSIGAQSTSTPVVYGGKVYFACSGSAALAGKSGNIAVADAETLEILYSVPLKAYPQCSLLASTAYVNEGYLYLYSTYNSNPGGIVLVKVKLDDNDGSDSSSEEIFDAKGFENYCMSSIICDKNGVLYYKNDSGYIFAVEGGEKPLPFTDTEAGRWYESAVRYVYKKGIMTGYANTNIFGVNDPLTREQFAIILYRIDGSKETEFTDVFPDVKPERFYSDAVSWAYRNGIVTGYLGGDKAGLFGIGDVITREQMAVMMKRYAAYCGRNTDNSKELSDFSDGNKVSRFALDAVKWCVAEGIISGKTDKKVPYIDPQGNTTRAECATIIMRFLG